MRCYLVVAKNNDGNTIARRIASTNADARAVREDVMETFDLRKKDVEIEQHEVPVDKPGLIAYLNELLVEQDIGETEGDE